MRLLLLSKFWLLPALIAAQTGSSVSPGGCGLFRQQKTFFFLLISGQVFHSFGLLSVKRMSAKWRHLPHLLWNSSGIISERLLIQASHNYWRSSALIIQVGDISTTGRFQHIYWMKMVVANLGLSLPTLDWFLAIATLATWFFGHKV